MSKGNSQLARVHALALNTMDDYGLLTQGWTFGFDDAVRRAGQCNYRNRRITLSRHFAHGNTEEEVMTTILHEIAHALVGPGHGHNAVWKAKAVELGIKPERCYDQGDRKVEMPKGKWKFVCIACGWFVLRHKQTKKRVYHPACGPERGVIRIVRNTEPN